MGALPTEYVSERVRARALACLGRAAHAKEAATGTAALVLGSADPDLRTQVGEVFDRAGLVCERTGDWVGVEIAGSAKNAAALAAAAAAPHGLNAAGIAAAGVWRECVDFALAKGARLETFSGLAGVGDLTATVLAPKSRNRQAGELLGAGVPAEKIPGSHRPGLGGPRLGPADRANRHRRRDRRAQPRRAGGADRGRDRRKRMGSGLAARRAGAKGCMRLVTLAGVRDEIEADEAATPTLPPPPASKAELDRDFSELYRAHLRDVYSYAYYRVGNHHDAEDLTEQAFLQAYRHFERAQRQVQRTTVATVADPDGPQPRLELLPQSRPQAGGEHRRDRATLPTPTRPSGSSRVARSFAR